MLRGIRPKVIKIIKDNKKDFIDLLLLADEQESMIDKYLERGDMFALYHGDLKSICVVTQEDDGIFELKNLATYHKYQGQGYGTSLINYIFKHYMGRCKTMLVGTGDSPGIIRFYENCGFVLSHRIKDFFIDNYDQPMFEDGVQLFDMVYLKKDF
jgi:GNAT superfamily N-acetyltransferase